MFSDFVLSIFLGLTLLGIPICIMYKYRDNLRRWIKNPDYGDLRTWEAPRAERAKRSVIKAQWKLEDAEKYLKYLEEESEKKEAD